MSTTLQTLRTSLALARGEAQTSDEAGMATAEYAIGTLATVSD